MADEVPFGLIIFKSQVMSLIGGWKLSHHSVEVIHCFSMLFDLDFEVY
jgi:hypothetical protein